MHQEEDEEEEEEVEVGDTRVLQGAPDFFSSSAFFFALSLLLRHFIFSFQLSTF